MLGTPTVLPKGSETKPNLPPSVERVLDAIGAHPSKASESYYLKYFSQYFGMMTESIKELRRVVTTGASGCCTLVVQDSYYKDIHVDLPTLISDLAGEYGWALVERRNYSVTSTMASINTKARGYRKAYSAVEAALTFR
jgi:hypothetical protein